MEESFRGYKDTIIVSRSPDTKLAGESSGDLSLHACAHLNIKYLLPYISVTDFHLPKQNTLFLFHSKKVRWAETGPGSRDNEKEKTKLISGKPGKSWRLCPAFSRSIHRPCGCCPACSTGDEKQVPAPRTSHTTHPHPRAAESQHGQGQAESHKEVPHPNGSKIGRASMNPAAERILASGSPLA